MRVNPGALTTKRLFLTVLVFLLATDLAIFLGVPVVRQVLGFVFFTTMPGFLIVRIMKLDRLRLTETAVLSVGLSVSCLMFVGLLMSWAYPALGNDTPISTVPVVVTLSLFTLVLGVAAYMRNRRASPGQSTFGLDRREKLFLLLPSFFPLVSIAGMRLMNLTDSNALLMVLLFSVPAYALVMVALGRKVPPRIHAPLILLTAVSILLLPALRSNHLIGADTHSEYFYSQLVYQAGRWQMFSESPLDACLSVTLLPAMYQSILSIDPEYLFKLLYPLLMSVSPLAVYVVARKYLSGPNALLTAFFFISYDIFINTTTVARTNMAILFFALVVMVLFHDGIPRFAKRTLFIILAMSVIVSHYSATYIFLFALALTWAGTQVLTWLVTRRRAARPITAKSASSIGLAGSPQTVTHGEGAEPASQGTSLGASQPSPKAYITLGMVMLCSVLLFAWYSQATAGAFDTAVTIVKDTFANLNLFFWLEARGSVTATLLGQGILQKEVVQGIMFVVSWTVIAFIAVGVLSTVARYRRTTAVPGSANGKPDFLRSRFELEHIALALACGAILAISVILPLVLKYYGMDRAYFQMTVVLAPFFVIGGITVARFIRARPYWVLLPVVFLYFASWAGTLEQAAGIPRSIVLNSEGRQYELSYIHDQENYASNWLKRHMREGSTAYHDNYGNIRLSSQAGIGSEARQYPKEFIEDKKDNWLREGYFYLRYFNVVNGRFVARWFREDKEGYLDFDKSEYDELFDRMGRIYDNGGAVVMKVRPR